MILLTRTKEQCKETRSKYPDLDFVDFPCIKYTEPSDCYKELDDVIRKNHLYEWVIFLSQKAAETYFERLLAIGGNFFNLSNHLKFAAIGQKTKDFIEKEVNMPVDFMPSKADSETFILEFLSKHYFDMQCKFKVLLPRSELAQDDFKEKFELTKNYELEIVPAYNTVCPKYSKEELEVFKTDFNKITKVVFTSSSCVENFKSLIPDLDLRSKEIISIGLKTTETIKDLYQDSLDITQPEEASLKGIFKALETNLDARM